MSLTTSEMTPADIAAVTRSNGNNGCNDGWGGGHMRLLNGKNMI